MRVEVLPSSRLVLIRVREESRGGRNPSRLSPRALPFSDQCRLGNWNFVDSLNNVQINQTITLCTYQQPETHWQWMRQVLQTIGSCQLHHVESFKHIARNQPFINWFDCLVFWLIRLLSFLASSWVWKKKRERVIASWIHGRVHKSRQMNKFTSAGTRLHKWAYVTVRNKRRANRTET